MGVVALPYLPFVRTQFEEIATPSVATTAAFPTVGGGNAKTDPLCWWVPISLPFRSRVSGLRWRITTAPTGVVRVRAGLYGPNAGRRVGDKLDEGPLGDMADRIHTLGAVSWVELPFGETLDLMAGLYWPCIDMERYDTGGGDTAGLVPVRSERYTPAGSATVNFFTRIMYASNADLSATPALQRTDIAAGLPDGNPVAPVPRDAVDDSIMYAGFCFRCEPW